MNSAAATATRTATGFDIVFPDGTTEAIKSSAAYTHVVILFRDMGKGPAWGVASEHKTEAAAHKRAFFGPVAASKTIVAITD